MIIRRQRPTSGTRANQLVLGEALLAVSAIAPSTTTVLLNRPCSGDCAHLVEHTRKTALELVTANQPFAALSDNDGHLVDVGRGTSQTGDARSTLAREQLLSSYILSAGVPAAVRQSRNTTPLERELHVDWLRFNCTYPSLHMRVMKGIPARLPLLASSIEHD